MSLLAGIIVAILLGTWAGVLWVYRDPIRRCWIEPVLAHPVLIVESDDWGPGPPEDSKRLAGIAECLHRHRDATGHPAVMTLGIVLGVADTEGLQRNGLRQHARLCLDDPPFCEVLGAIRRGQVGGVFACQLHGLDHYWPPTLLQAAATDETVQAWLTQPGTPRTESLPPHLQSRWVDGTVLPTQPLPEDAVRPAVAEEVTVFERVFGAIPRVAVPPTFIWTRPVEQAWEAAGIRVIVTPGQRFTMRDAAGRPASAHGPIYNGERTAGNAVYVVRDRYFEPSLGHTAARMQAAIDEKRRQGRPALLETHRFNFTGDEVVFLHSLRELDKLLSTALRELPELRFLSTEELGRAYQEHSDTCFNTSRRVRIHVWLKRLAAIHRLRKLAWLSGLAIPAGLAAWLTASRAPDGVEPENRRRAA